MACGKKKTTDRFKCWIYCKEEAKTKVKSTVKQLFYNKFEGNTATKHGLLQEQPTKAKYLKEK